MIEKNAVTVIVGSIGAFLLSLTAIFSFWGDFGWKIRKDYDAEHEGLPTAELILQEVKATKEQSALYHRHWECDEHYEEILEKRTRKAGLDVIELALAVELNLELENLEAKYDELGCIDFVE